ncbi:MAG: hypothetical protein RR420_07555 [Anaerovoracaceae bacterium]
MLKGRELEKFRKMKACIGKTVKLTFCDEEIFEGLCTNFYQKESDDKDHMLEFDRLIIYAYEIKKIEILSGD